MFCGCELGDLKMVKILLKGSFNEEGYRGAVAEPADRETAARQLFTKAGLRSNLSIFPQQPAASL